MAKSDTAENMVLDWLLGGSSPTRPAGRFLALYTSNPTDADSGAEVAGGGYARQSVAFNAAAGGTTSNSALISFTNMPAATITHFGVRSASTAGTLLYHGALTASKTTNSGDTFEVAAGDLDISEN